VLKAVGVPAEDVDEDEEDYGVGAKKPRKVLVRMKEGERLMASSQTFKRQMEDEGSIAVLDLLRSISQVQRRIDRRSEVCSWK